MPTLRRAAATALLYLAVARYSVVLQDFTGVGAVFWPGAGVTLTALLLSPRRSWPWILLGVGMAELGHDLALGFGVIPSGSWALANAVEPLAAAWLIVRWRADRFTNVRGTVVFVVACMAGAGIGSLMGAVGTTTLSGSQHYAVTAAQWLVGDGLGMITVVPLGLVLFRRVGSGAPRTGEAALAGAAILAMSVLVFGMTNARSGLRLDYLILLPLVWSAVRFRVTGATVALFVTAQVANLFHAFGRGPFVVAESAGMQSAAHLQLFLAAVGLTILLLASRTEESAAFHALARTREQLIAAVSHELRTPLTPILGFSELLLERNPSLDDQARRDVEVIHRNGRHLTALVDDLLQASRARRGALPVQPEQIPLEDFLDDLFRDRDATAVTASVSHRDVAVWADRTHLTQIVTTLLDNAHRYGRPPVEIDVTSDGQITTIAVVDHGDGVPNWFVPELFDAFAQATSGDRRPSIGLGLGLPIARDLARANAGDLIHDAEADGGRFVVVLPAEVPSRRDREALREGCHPLVKGQ